MILKTSMRIGLLDKAVPGHAISHPREHTENQLSLALMLMNKILLQIPDRELEVGLAVNYNLDED